jgi:ligand-binding sensor domain-containing protein
VFNGKRKIFGLAWLFFFLVIQFNSGLKAQGSVSFKHLTVNEGLSQNTVFAITQDSNGFLWFGTRGGGLNKFDVYDFYIYRHVRELPCSLSDNIVLSILEDSKGVLWIGTRDGGINSFDPATGEFTEYSLDKLSEAYILKFSINDQGLMFPSGPFFIMMQTKEDHLT